jgi:hypothetical protein
VRRVGPDPVPHGFDSSHRGSRAGQHPRAHPWRCLGARSGVSLGGGRGLRARDSLHLRVGRALRFAGAVRRGLLRGQIRGCAVPDLPGNQGVWSREGFAVSKEAAQVGLKIVFVQGVASNVLNPKVALCFPAFLPQPVDPVGRRRSHATVGAWVDLRAADLGGLQCSRLPLQRPRELVEEQDRLRKCLALADGWCPRWARAAPGLLGSLNGRIVRLFERKRMRASAWS